ncbi:MAG: hypothetical protein VX938_10680, partial [Myxococcota bacterium]|nr:hypothetical protein [Myxococcota bacterium]
MKNRVCCAGLMALMLFACGGEEPSDPGSPGTVDVPAEELTRQDAIDVDEVVARGNDDPDLASILAA